jgi:hypothetical protein
VTNEPRAQARAQLRQLLQIFRDHPDAQAVAPLIELAEQLDRAIASFHMEAIRFRMYTLGRQLHRPDVPLPGEAQALYEAVRHSLEAAGFQTRSVGG